MGKKYWEEYKKWLDSKPMCQCGCETFLNNSYSSYKASICVYGEPPRFINHHCKDRQKNKETNNEFMETKKVKFNGCKIEILYKEEKRCADFAQCPEYLNCLDFVVIKHHGSGWKKWTG